MKKNIAFTLLVIVSMSLYGMAIKYNWISQLFLNGGTGYSIATFGSTVPDTIKAAASGYYLKSTAGAPGFEFQPIDTTSELSSRYYAAQGRKEIYNMQMLASNFSPGVTYYFGQMPHTTITATIDRNALKFQRSGTITAAHFALSAYTTVGSNENISIFIRVNNTTDYLVATTGAATARREFTNTSLSIPISAGDYINGKITTPSWGTAPTNLVLGGYVELDY